METDNKIESGKIFGPMCLSTGVDTTYTIILERFTEGSLELTGKGS